MPIKFRCNYCRQFLGISRAQAGGIVDCPTCGRSIRVPQLDGTLQPLPHPEMNLQDAQLAKALDELARLAGSDSLPVSAVAESDVEFDEEPENEFPQLIPEPIPIEVPIPPTPIAIQPPMTEDEDAEPPPIDAAPASRDASIAREYAILAELAATPPAAAETARSDPDSSPRSPGPLPPERRQIDVRSSIPRVTAMIGVAFVAGMLFERFVKILEFKTPAATSAVNVTEASPKAGGQVTGRITYKSADGTSQPDRGARIIAFPLQRSGEAKLSVVGFRPSDAEADAKIAAAVLQAFGGAVATADEEGLFRLDLPAGAYQLLILSHFQSRDEKEQIDPALRKLLAAYFDKPDDLLGRVEFDFGPLKVKGTGDVRDHSFRSAQ